MAFKAWPTRLFTNRQISYFVDRLHNTDSGYLNAKNELKTVV